MKIKVPKVPDKIPGRRFNWMKSGEQTLYIFIQRSFMSNDDQGIPGRMFCMDDDFKLLGEFRTIELPWRDNRCGVSSIPPGMYTARKHNSRRFGNTIVLEDVNGRSYILTHNGNVAGDKTKGYKTHSQGCIIIGTKPGMLKMNGRWQRGVVNSRIAYRRFKDMVLDHDAFQVKITEV